MDMLVRIGKTPEEFHAMRPEVQLAYIGWYEGLAKSMNGGNNGGH